MKHTCCIILLLMSLSTGAQADTAQPQKGEPVRIGISDKSGSVLGLSFMPPDENGWDMTKSGMSVTLKKSEGSADENREIDAYLINLDAPAIPIASYIERIKKNTLEGYANNEKFKIRALNVTADPNSNQCARVHLLLEDTQPTLALNNKQTKWSEQFVLSCASLKYKRFGFEVRYYHRYYESNKDNKLADHANKVLESVVIEDK